MDVILVMDTMIVTNFFSHQSNQFGLIALALAGFVQIILLILGGCQNPNSDTSPTFGHQIDVTEDLYHRLKAGLFEVRKDPLICQVLKRRNPDQKLRFPFSKEEAPHQMVRISWERGSFWVKSDNHALVVIYMDEEAIFSHVQVATLEGFATSRIFRESIEHPIR